MLDDGSASVYDREECRGIPKRDASAKPKKT
jgi:hypothetical protein